MLTRIENRQRVGFGPRTEIYRYLIKNTSLVEFEEKHIKPQPKSI